MLWERRHAHAWRALVVREHVRIVLSWRKTLWGLHRLRRMNRRWARERAWRSLVHRERRIIALVLVRLGERHSSHRLVLLLLLRLPHLIGVVVVAFHLLIRLLRWVHG